MLARGESPYDTASLQPQLPALWMPTAVGFFSLLGFFDFESAQRIWFVLNAGGLAAMLYLCLPDPRSMPALLAGLFIAYFFPPTIHHFALGQVSILSALCLLGAVKLIERASWLSAFLLALGMVKPQIAVFVLFGASVYKFQTGGFRGLFAYGLKAFLAALILTLPLFMVEPAWVPDFIASLKSNTPEWTHPSILSQLDMWIGDWAYLLWAGTLFCALWLLARLWRNSAPEVAALWTLAITTLVTPYVWSWDFTLLLPILVHTFSKLNWKGKALLTVGYWLAWAGMAAIQLSGNYHNSRFWWVPLFFIGLTVSARVFMKLEGTPAAQPGGI